MKDKDTILSGIMSNKALDSLPIDKETGNPVLPNGIAIDPKLKLPIHSQTGYPIDLENFTFIDPRSGN